MTESTLPKAPLTESTQPNVPPTEVTQPKPPPRQRRPRQNDGPKWAWQFTVAAVLLLAFAVLIVVMLSMADGGDETVWQRRAYLFGGAQAIVFTAVGWLFGQEVNRSAAESAKQDANEAKQDADAARTETRQKAEEAADAKQRAAEERTRTASMASAIEHWPLPGTTSMAGSARDASASGGSSRAADAVVDLKAFVRDMHSESRSVTP
jgi:ABC-type Na+ efflux pump permease subunit